MNQGLLLPREGDYQTFTRPVVGEEGLEPSTFCSQNRRPARLGYTPIIRTSGYSVDASIGDAHVLFVIGGLSTPLRPPFPRLIRWGWCRRRDSNPHPFWDELLGLARLPITPRRHWSPRGDSNSQFSVLNRTPLPIRLRGDNSQHIKSYPSFAV